MPDCKPVNLNIDSVKSPYFDLFLPQCLHMIPHSFFPSHTHPVGHMSTVRTEVFRFLGFEGIRYI